MHADTVKQYEIWLDDLLQQYTDGLILQTAKC